MKTLFVIFVLVLISPQIFADQVLLLKINDKSMKLNQVANEVKKDLGATIKVLKDRKDKSTAVLSVGTDLTSKQKAELISKYKKQNVEIAFIENNSAAVIDLRHKTNRKEIKLKKNKNQQSSSIVQ